MLYVPSRWFLPRCLVVGPLALVIALTPAGAQTRTTEGGPTPQDSRNVYVAGPTVRLTSPVEGDLFAAGGRVIADQPVKGDATLFGGSVDIRAPIEDDLRAGGGDVTLESSVGGELYAGGGNVTLTRTSRVGQGASLAGGLITIDGAISGRLRASAQRVVINGEVSGDVRLFAETVELGPQARIGGSLKHASKTFKRAETAAVAGSITREQEGGSRRERDTERFGEHPAERDAISWIGMALGLLGLLAAGAVLVLLFPRYSADATERLRGTPWLSLAVGFGVLVGVPVLAVLLFVTVLGIPLGIATLALYPLLLLVGYLVGALFLAQRIRLGLGRAGEAGFRSRIGHLALALVALALLSLLPLAGPLAVFVTTIAGIGAAILELHRRRQTELPVGN